MYYYRRLSMKVIGLCGGSGAGKGTVCSVFAEFGIKSIDTDKLYHTLISTDSECTRELIDAFGDGINAHPGIDRRALRDIVFSSSDKLNLLNTITHKHILSALRALISESKEAPAIIVDAPLLFESGFNKECDVTVCVVADDDVRVNRITKRDGVTPEVARTRISSQISNGDLIKACDYAIENNSTVSELRDRVTELFIKLFNN